MRIFAGDWVRNMLERMGMTRDQAIESRMVSRRIESAQKKVEERNFDVRKNLLEYDEVMDHQRKRTYGFRQDILDGGNCKTRIMDMLDAQVDLALENFLDIDYGPASFAKIDLSKGADYLQPDWGVKSFCRWAKDKFQVTLNPQDLAEKPGAEIKDHLRKEIRKLYRQKEIEFPVTLAMVRFMADREHTSP